MKDVIRKCTICKRFNQRTFLPPPTADIPSYRLESDFAFQHTGLDFCGPLYVKEKCCENSFTKVYILLLTCATSRALHLELVPDMGDESFIRGIIRFFARKGYPELVIHDNAKTFKSREVKHFFLKQGIKQEFILALAPWWGGFYERLVRNVKSSLRKILGNSLLSFEEVSTFLCEIEGTLNSRPLSYLNEDDIDEPLTPFHLLYGRNILSNAKLNKTRQTFPTHNKRLKHISFLLDHFWRRFSTCYLGDLKQFNLYRKQKSSVKQDISVGDIVLLKEDLLPRNRWRMEKVKELVIGRDGFVRGAKLQTTSKEGRRTTRNLGKKDRNWRCRSLFFYSFPLIAASFEDAKPLTF